MSLVGNTASLLFMIAILKRKRHKYSMLFTRCLQAISFRVSMDQWIQLMCSQINEYCARRSKEVSSGQCNFSIKIDMSNFTGSLGGILSGRGTSTFDGAAIAAALALNEIISWLLDAQICNATKLTWVTLKAEAVVGQDWQEHQ